MKKTESVRVKDNKDEYIAPNITVYEVLTEQGFAASGSKNEPMDRLEDFEW